MATDPVVEAINDLTRVTIAIHGDFKSAAEAIRSLHGLSIPQSRIAAILAIPPNQVSSAIAKEKKRSGAKGGVSE